MSSLLIAFFASFASTYLIIRFKHLHNNASGDFDLRGPQKFHTKVVPRIGGISIALGILIAALFKFSNSPSYEMELTLIACAIPTFLIGLAEDLTKKISVRKRLLFTALSAALAIHFLQIQILKLDIPGIDFVLAIPGIGIIFTIFAITGVANAYNIIDGFNGLSSMVGIITLLALAYMGYVFTDYVVIYLALVMAAATLGFFIWNYPRGLVFLGDGGAYLIGFWIAALSIMLTYRHVEISPWFALLINGYPILETLFTIYRRKIHQGKSPGQPDGIHFHTLIYRRVLTSAHKDKDWFSTNARTAPYLWLLAVISVTPAIIWWQSTLILMIATVVFTVVYVWLYKKIVNFKTPKWFHFI